MTMTFDRARHRKLAAASAPRKCRAQLRRIGLTLLAAAAFAAWLAALPALLASDGLSWHAVDCGRPGYRDPVTGRPASPLGGGSSAACQRTAAEQVR